MTMGWVFRLLSLASALLFVFLFILLLIEGDGHPFAFFASLAFAILAGLTAIECNVMRVIYSPAGIRFVSLLPRRYGKEVRWEDVHHIREDFDKLVVTFDSGKKSIYTFFRGWRSFLRFVQEHHPEVDIR